MDSKIRSFSRSIVAKLIVPAIMLLLPLLTVGGAPGANTAIASAPIPSSPINSSNGAADKYPLLVMRVYFDSLAQRDALAYELSPEEKSTTGGYLTVIRDRNLYDSLRARGLRVEIDEAQSAIVSGMGPKPDTFYNGYKTVEEIYAFIDQKVAQYPNLVQKVDIGDSWCKTHAGQCTLPDPNNGYDIFSMHITNQAIPGPKPVFWAESAIHAREIATPEVMMRLTNWLLDGYNTNADAHWMVDYQDIWITLTVNPDGHHIVESGGNSPYYQRKNGDSVGGSGCSWPPTTYDQFGVDNNRNFPFLWNCCGGSSTDPCSQTYHGTGAESEDENQAIVNMVRTLIPDQRGPGDTDPAPITATGVFQDLHSQSEQNLYTWGWSNNNMPNFTETRNIAAHMSALNAGGNGYYYGSIYGGLYPVDGGSIDWSYGELGIASVSTEIGGNDFLPAYACIDNPGCGSSRGIWPDNKNQLIFTAKIAATPYLTIHGPDTNLASSTPITVTQGATPILTSTVNFAWTGNVLSQNVGAAEYYIDTPPMAGGTGTPMQAIDGTFNSPTEGVQATIDTGPLSVGRHIVFMRGRGANDFSGFQTWGALSAVFLDVTSNGGATPTPTNTAVPPTNTAVPPTNTAVPPTDTAVPTDTATLIATDTAVASGTPLATDTATQVVTGTPPTATETPTACTLSFEDVPPDQTFYPYIQCLACRGIINGYPCGDPGEPCNGNNDPYFRPGSDVTRGQFAKIASNSAGFNDAAGPQQYEDVAPGSTFYDFVWRLTNRGFINGYPCGGPGEPCGSGNLPYFRPNANVTRGQLSKIDANARGLSEPPGDQQFEDVLPGSTFYDYIWRLTSLGYMNGYPCGGTGEPCGPNNLPYFRPGANATRGQASKIVSNTFFPACQP